jgi:hypothetical protein
MAVSSYSEGLDQFEEGNAAGGHASEVEDSAVSPSMIGGVLERRRLLGFVKALPCPFLAVEPPC